MFAVLLERCNHLVLQEGVLFGGVDFSDVFAEHFFRSVAVQFLGALVPTGDVVIQVGGNHRVVDLVDDLGLLPQRFFGLLALGDVLDCSHHPAWLVFLGRHVLPLRKHNADRSIGPVDSVFHAEGFLFLDSVIQHLFQGGAIFGMDSVHEGIVVRGSSLWVEAKDTIQFSRAKH